MRGGEIRPSFFMCFIWAGVMTGSDIDVELVQRNFAAIDRFLSPGLADRLRAHSPISKLIRNADGDWDVEFRGELLYGPGGRADAEAMAKRIEAEQSSRFFLTPPQTATLDRASGDFLFHVMKRANDEGIKFQEMPASSEAYHLVSYGLGLGYHLPNLIEMTKCEALCIVEPNLDFLYHSMAVMEWEPLLERNQRWPSVSIIAQSEGISESVRNVCRATNPTSIDGMVAVHPYPNDTMFNAAREFARDATMVMTGLGFLVDEAEMARASYRNLCGGEYRLFKRRNIRGKVPAFVIGSGPSIDHDIEIIKEYQDRAVIFACGTSSRILLANGIQPDFMLLLENGETPCLAMEKVAAQYDVGDAVMIASNTVSPRVRSICKETVYFIRPALCPFPVFNQGPEYALPSVGPTVVNTGLSAALSWGFNEIYLFGVDLGSRDPKSHHSKHSAYVRRQGEPEDQDILPFDATFDHPAVGNFGGVVFTEIIMEWTRDNLAGLISSNAKQAVIYNCSDGVRIDHTIPKSAEAIDLTATPEQKRQELDAIMAALPRSSGEAALKRWRDADGLRQIKELCDRIKAEIPEFPDSCPAFTRKMLPLLLTDHNRIPSFGEYFVRGSLFLSMASADYFLRRAVGGSGPDGLKVVVIEEIKRLLDNIVRWSEWFFDHIDEYESSIDFERDFCGLSYD